MSLRYKFVTLYSSLSAYALGTVDLREVLGFLLRKLLEGNPLVERGIYLDLSRSVILAHS